MAVVKMYPDPEDYQEAEDQFMRAIGVCVTRWAFTDRQLFSLMQWALQTSAVRAALVHYNQPGLKGRLQLIDKILQKFLKEDEHTDDWRSIYKDLDKLIPTRNVIVHSPLMRTGTSNKNGKAVYEYSIYVEPNQRLIKAKFDGFGGKGELRIDDLKAHAEAVDAITVRLQLFRNALSASL